MALEGNAYYVDTKTVTTAGTPEALTTREIECSSVVLTPKTGNTNPVFLADPATTTKLITIPSGGLTIAVNNPALLVVDVTTNGEGVTWVAS